MKTKLCSCSASDSAYSYTFSRSVVCLSVVCHIRARCLNRWTDLDAVWQVQNTFGVQWHIVLDGGSLTTQGKEGFGGSHPEPKHAIANCSQTVGPGEYKRGVRSTGLATATPLFAQITLDLVYLLTLQACWRPRRWCCRCTSTSTSRLPKDCWCHDVHLTTGQSTLTNAMTSGQAAMTSGYLYWTCTRGQSTEPISAPSLAMMASLAATYLTSKRTELDSFIFISFLY